MSAQANATITGGHATAALVAQAIAGDRDAFATLYNEHRPAVFAYLLRKTGDRALAEDLTQDVFVRALRRIDTFQIRHGANFAGWLATIARNIHLDHVKLSRTRLEVPVGEMADGDERDRSAEASALREFDVAEARDAVTSALLALTPYQRKCVELRFLRGLSVPETAAALGKGLGATKTLQFRALRVMQSALTSEAPEGAAA